jgi:REP element-mobilizing transposase RayT
MNAKTLIGPATNRHSRPQQLTLPPRSVITLFTRDEIPVFKFSVFNHMLLQSVQFNVRRKLIKVYGWTILPTSVHLILRSDETGRFVNSLKNYTSEKIIEYLQHYHPQKVSLFNGGGIRASVWNQTFDQRDAELFGTYRRELKYLHFLPVEKKLVQSPLEYPWSSARDRLENRGLVWLSG